MNENTASSSRDQQFKEGDKISLIRVRFPGNAKVHSFFVGRRKFQYGQKVVAMSDRGLTVGHISSFPYELPFNESMLPLKTITKVATDEDIERQRVDKAKETEIEVICLQFIEKHQLDMNLTHVEFVQNGRKAVFYFTAPQRVDFRGLVKDLVAKTKMRVELRQISVRDRTAALGAIGVCGLQTCCSSFLTKYGNVSIKMAKNQNLSLLPSKLNGVCGQVKCCVSYENEVYTEKRNKLPKEGDFVQTKNGDRGKVYRLHVLPEQFEMLTDEGYKRRYTISEYKDKSLPSDWVFPKEFPSITDETNEVVGL